MTANNQTQVIRHPTDPLCEAKEIWEMDGTRVTEFTECANDAVGRYRIEGRHGGESVDWLCEDCREQWADAIIEEVRA